MDGEDMVDEIMLLRQQIERLKVEREQLKATALERTNTFAGTLKILRQYLLTGKWQQPDGVLDFLDAEIVKLSRSGPRT